MSYTIVIDGKEINYGPYTRQSNFSDKAWTLLCHEMAKKNQSKDYKKYKNDDRVIEWIGSLIALSERYEALLEELPQSSFSKSGTHPVWVANAVNENTLSKADTQSDVKDAINGNDTLEGLVKDLKEYFNIG